MYNRERIHLVEEKVFIRLTMRIFRENLEKTLMCVCVCVCVVLRVGCGI